MARTAIANGDSGSSVRASLNTLFCNSTTTDPGVANDNTQGYGVGSSWYNSTTDTFWDCRDASTGAAVWQKLANGTFPGYISGSYYDLHEEAMAPGAGSVSAALILYPFQIFERVTLSALTMRVTTLSAVGSGNDVAMIGIYANKPSTNRPTGSALASVTGLSTTATGGVSGALAGNVTFDPGWYWDAGQAANSTCRLSSILNNGKLMQNRMGALTLANGTSSTGLMITAVNTYGTFPDLTSASLTETANASPTAIRIGGKVA